MFNPESVRTELLDLVGNPAYRPTTIRGLLHRLAIDKVERNSFKRVLRALVAEEAIVRIAGNRFAAPRDGAGETAVRRGPSVSGVLQINRRGFGFVTPDGGGRDIFVPPHDIRDLLGGDRVSIRVGRPGVDGRTRGSIVKVLERSRRRVLGVYRSEGGAHGPGRIDAPTRSTVSRTRRAA